MECAALSRPTPCDRGAIMLQGGDASCATHLIDRGESIGRHLIAAPGNVPVRPHQYQLALVDPGRIGLFDGDSPCSSSGCRRIFLD
jgi:hypothetical protein